MPLFLSREQLHLLSFTNDEASDASNTSRKDVYDESAEETVTLVESPTNQKPTRYVYLVKNAANMDVEAVISAVLNMSCDQPETSQTTSSIVNSSSERKNRSAEQMSQKVVIKGSDGKENMVVLDVPMLMPVEKDTEDVPGGSEEVDDPTWTPRNADHEYFVGPSVRSSANWSKLKRARNAVRNSVKTLRLPKPHKKREISKDRSAKKAARKQIPISKDDPNYAIMMEKFAKPVSVSTLKRHGLYLPKQSSYKIDAPYKKDVAPYIEKLSDTEFKCKICLTAKFRWNYKAEIHILEHLDWRPFKCDVCGRAFTQNQYLRKHKRLHFPDDATFMCEVCGKGFQRRYYLTYHMDEHFDRTYTCEECGRKFSLRRKHDEHVRYHHKCHYSICDICGQTLRTTALSRHRKHHTDKEPRKRKEKVSNTGTAQISWVSCDICGRAFRSTSSRDQHMEDHNNPQNPFQCEECALYFKTKRSLNDHTLQSHIVEDESRVATRVLDELTSEVPFHEEI